MNNDMKTLASERGIALIVVLLLMVVLSGLATGFALTGQVEAQMAQNEVYFAGARAAAEAGLNRALVAVFADTTTNWIKGADGLVDAGNPSATVNSDNGSLTFLLGAGPYYVDSANRYSYEVQILDDDNNLLYETPLTSAQLAPSAMNEDGSAYSNINDRVVLRAIGYGPNGTVVKLARIIESVDTVNTTSTTTTVLSNPAILVNGNFLMDGAITVTGSSGSVHANGNLEKTGASGTITGNATASGTYSGATFASGTTGGGRPTINVPNINAADYMSIADFKLTSTGTVQTLQGGVWTNCTTSQCTSTDWSFNSSTGKWSSGSNPTSATYYVEGDVDIGNTQGSGNKAMSVIATGSINVQGGSAKLTPENDEKYQFIANGDIEIVNGADLDDPTTVEGQIMARGQFEAGGNMEFQGRVMVQDVANAGNLIANNGNRIHGSVKFTYNGTLGAVSTTTVSTSSSTTYVNNVSGWMEQ